MGVAASAIAVMKKKELGRASFIPLKEIVAGEPRGEKAMDPLIRHISFEKEFTSAFEYIFSNTYIVGKIEESKTKLGRSRYVTLEGELVEPSGMVTGGSTRQIQSQAVLSSKLNKLNEEKIALALRLGSARDAIDQIRREAAGHETELLNISIELRHANAEYEKLVSSLDALKTERATLVPDNQRLVKLVKQLGTRKAALDDELERQRANMPSAQKNRLEEQNSDSQSSALVAEQQKTLKQEVEGMRIKAATLVKEDEMLGTRHTQIKGELSSISTQQEALEKQRGELVGELKKIASEKAQLEDKIRSHGKLSESIYKKLSELDEKIGAAGAERGEKSAKLEKIVRRLMEVDGAKASLETRLSDIKAELLGYTALELFEGEARELEKALSEAKGQIEGIGAVNLKAPEAYDSKMAETKESVAKLDTLKSEKASIMSMINEIETKKLNVFMQVFSAINNNFSELHSHVFTSNGALVLDDQKNPFESGLSFKVEIDGRKPKRYEELSGGQKSLVMLMLVFAIQRTDPKSFYIFDEIDIALDKENSKNLSRLIKQLQTSRSSLLYHT